MGISLAGDHGLLFSLFRSSKRTRRRGHSQSLPVEAEMRPVTSTSAEAWSSKEITNPKSAYDEAHTSDMDSEEPDLRELNDSLMTLAAIFPDVQIEVFREMLSSFDKESRLAVVTESLLKHKLKWLKGRYRVANSEPLLNSRELVPNEEKFRSVRYKTAVKNLTYREFKGLSRSTINAVLAEFNHSYTLARPTLVKLTSKSWRLSFTSLFMRNKSTSAFDVAHHPLVWQSSDLGLMLKTSNCPDLDKELFELFIVSTKQQAQAEQEERDYIIALDLNNTEAEQTQSLHDCECCFAEASFEELAACEKGHLICLRCIRYSINEAIFGQGWQRYMNLSLGTLRCIAAASDECSSCVPLDFISRAFSRDKMRDEILRKLEERLAEDNLLKSQLPLIRCVFCNYAEVDEIYVPETLRSWKFKRLAHFPPYIFIVLVSGVCIIPLVLPVFLMCSFIIFLALFQKKLLARHLDASIQRVRRKRLGLKFVCQNKGCLRASCLSCSKGWSDIHVCHESSLQALRIGVELAMSMAIKRTCPRCNTSFVKSSGCNKLTCICGYQMCYVCRKEIGNGEGYRHFCEHFRPNGDRECHECSKCDLYHCEDNDAVVRKAKQEAERQWMERESTGLGCDEKIRKVLEEKWKQDGDTSLLKCRIWKSRIPDGKRILDTLVETFISID
ncbi:hypothetical protein K3495_g10903 [Podosphaera aphanis]|nr:hypothetical protein K3495_g10903 [Podosphaera aphanis]